MSFWSKFWGKGTRAERAFAELVESPRIPEEQRSYLQVAWLDELLSARSDGGWNRRFFLLLRLLAITGALVLPALASLNLGANPSKGVRVATFVVTIVVAVSTGAIQVFGFGTEWGINKQYSNALEAEGWAFFQNAGLYRTLESGESRYEMFFDRIERLRRLRIERGVTAIMAMAADTKEPSPQPDPATPQ